MTSHTLRSYSLLHKWTSLACTVFLLMLCLTGLPLIFHDEIAHWNAPVAGEPKMEGSEPWGRLDAIASDAVRRHPREIIRFVSVDEDGETAYVLLGTTASALESSAVLEYDAGTGMYLRDSPLRQGFMYLMLRLHVDLFAGVSGMLFLGAMGVLFVVSLATGAVVYGPFMRTISFGAIRTIQGSRLYGRDLHNLLGIATLLWACVVGATGVINTLAVPIFSQWQSTELAALLEPWRDKPHPSRLSSIQQAVQTAELRMPGKELAFVAFPGTNFSGEHHYGVYLRGPTPLTKRLITPALIEAESGGFSGTREMPWYVTMLKVSQPLHFGDYGGPPLKILWALLDVITIMVLVSGLYLWWKKRHTTVEQLLSEAGQERESTLAPAAGTVFR